MLYIHYCVIFAPCSYYFSSLSVRRRQASYQFNLSGIAGFASNSGTPSVQHAARPWPRWIYYRSREPAVLHLSSSHKWFSDFSRSPQTASSGSPISCCLIQPLSPGVCGGSDAGTFERIMINVELGISITPQFRAAGVARQICVLSTCQGLFNSLLLKSKQVFSQLELQ